MSGVLQVFAILLGCMFFYALGRRSLFAGVKKPLEPIVLNGVDLSLFISLVCFVMLFCSEFGKFCKNEFPDNETLAIFIYAIAYQLLAITCIFGFKKFSFAKFDFGFSFNFEIFKKSLKCFVQALLSASILAAIINLIAFLSTGELPEKQDVIEIFKNARDEWSIALAIFSFVILAPIFEELFFRAILYRSLAGTLAMGISSEKSREVSAVAVSLLFAMAHGNAFAFVPLFVVALFFTSLYERTGSIIAPMVCHSLFNLFNALVILYSIK